MQVMFWGMYRDWRVTLAYVGHVVGNIQRIESHISICRSCSGECTEIGESH